LASQGPGYPRRRLRSLAPRDVAGVKTAGNSDAASADVLAELVGLIVEGRLEVPIARAYRLADVRAAYRELEERHTRGKIVLTP
jgi:NADPH:quinone reductase-like Zn-dependent oxidoreductase